jgi:hypothetical protein
MPNSISLRQLCPRLVSSSAARPRALVRTLACSLFSLTLCSAASIRGVVTDATGAKVTGAISLI